MKRHALLLVSSLLLLAPMRVLRAQSEGETWQRNVALVAALPVAAQAQWARCPLDSAQIDQLYAQGDTLVAWATGGHRQFAAFSSDAGSSWERREVFQGSDSIQTTMLAVSPVNLDVWYAVTAAYNPARPGYLIPTGLYKTTDAGKTWTLQNDTVQSLFPSYWEPTWKLFVSWANASVLFVVGGGWQRQWLLRSDDGGATWRSIDRFGSTFGLNLTFGQDGKDSALLYVAAEGVYEYDFYWSTDGGEHWTPRYFSLPLRGAPSFFIAGLPARGDVHAVYSGPGASTAVWYTSDFGATWDSTPSVGFAGMGRQGLTDFLIAPENPQLRFATLDSGIFVKYPDTTGWTPLGPIVETDTLYRQGRLAWDDSYHTLYAGTARGVWKWQLPTEVRVIAGLVPRDLHVGPTYPNPASGITTIPFHLGAPARVEVSVSNAAGETLLTVPGGPHDAGDHVLPLDLRGLPPGTYFCTLAVGKTRATREVVLIR